MKQNFDHYWSDFFTSGYANEVQPLVWSNDAKTILKIKFEAKKLASKYSVNNKIIFPWEVYNCSQPLFECSHTENFLPL